MTSQSAATLRSRYAVQAASDLEENRRRQRELAEKLAMLREEEALLIEIMALAEHHQGDAELSPLPEQAQDEPTLTQERLSRTPGAATKAPRSARTGSRAKAAAKGRSRRPLLGDLLLDLLAGHSEPHLAKDLREELMVQHPDREPTPQVVRNTLESLVAKGQVRRHKEERSVMYTLVDRGHRRTPAG
ncbi:hypothetical protein [Streptomyces sp. FH025]|uniref:hypothetical protein n=1 Tax=Streptomyces sp. FH025 TaxID=2815937 RepID=UPI001A9E9114|nr:hypothetical protein [Streptomyces sp. FH025]MBO1413757.1 hypothetical protein [Streptomyces sp. FH025]